MVGDSEVVVFLLNGLEEAWLSAMFPNHRHGDARGKESDYIVLLELAMMFRGLQFNPDATVVTMLIG